MKNQSISRSAQPINHSIIGQSVSQSVSQSTSDGLSG